MGRERAEHLPVRFVRDVGRITLFVATAFHRGFSQRPAWGQVLEEMYKVGIRALPVLLAVSAFVGSNTALQGYHAFKSLGGQSLVGMFVAIAGVRELAPLVASMIIAAKTGTEMTTTIAMMRITEQIDALEVMSVDPYWYLVAPRLIGITLIVPILTTLAVFVCFVTALAVSVAQLEVDAGTFLETAMMYVSFRDILYGFLKGIVFGMIIGVVSCYFGFNSERGPLGIGRAANRAIVTMVVVSAMANYLMSQVLYG